MKELLPVNTAIGHGIINPAGDIQTGLVDIVGKGFRKIRLANDRTRSGVRLAPSA